MTHRAFVYGCNGLPGRGKLKYARDDAARLTEILRSPRCNYEVISPKPAQAKHVKLYELEKATLACAPDDTFLFYFSGHGVLEQGKLQLVWQEKVKDEREASVGVSQVLYYVDRCKAASKLVVLDCCHAGAGAHGARGEGMPVEEATKPCPDNYLMLMAGDRLERINEFPELGGSFLGDALRRALKDDFDQADQDKDKRLSFEDLTHWIKLSWEGLGRYLKEGKQRLVPLPHSFGQTKGGRLFLTPEVPRWTPHGIPWRDGSTMMLLPLRPRNGLALCIGQHPVTNAQYKRFVTETDHPEPAGKYFPGVGNRFNFHDWREFYPWRTVGFNDPEQPVTCVSLVDVLAYRNWLNAKLGGPPMALVPSPRLWQVAVLGREFGRGNLAEEPPLALLLPGVAIHHRSAAPAPVDRNGQRANLAGVSDLIGNVWEWASSIDPRVKLGRPASGYRLIAQGQQVDELLGGGFQDDLETADLKAKTEMSISVDAIGADRTLAHFDLGFRLASLVNVATLPAEVRLVLSLQRTGSEALWEDTLDMPRTGNA
ncbi:SUMF1/EgtB/PvdO family nonheme iron enzyme [Paracoccus sp. EF6]|uniref:SUMF1/EgtB/PvdO family nonheme iron enzyme n=1 Tax=Paracoccus benzoatiresistens TaxID=2997341 RepID=A0ABT4J8N5_9RHOB|nr:SUMF1/EgtB/PvdO family nonheme iron enzyme [Paracoccus sp. EF6]MCZ0962952.1 SUMF1/EgtB/PvdO family nonheme iron enzyme [Paracoccus sp. EF6]